jgi:hypothetical protein
VNVDTNVLINVLDNPNTPAGRSAMGALRDRVAVVSLTAAEEYVVGSESAGVTSELAAARLTAYIGTGLAEWGPNPDMAQVGMLMLKGVKYEDAKIVSSGDQWDLKTLTADTRLANKIPSYIERYEPK